MHDGPGYLLNGTRIIPDLEGVIQFFPGKDSFVQRFLSHRDALPPAPHIAGFEPLLVFKDLVLLDPEAAMTLLLRTSILSFVALSYPRWGSRHLHDLIKEMDPGMIHSRIQ